MRKTIKILSILLLITSCTSNSKVADKETILLADREAPIGWIYLRIFADSTFEFESRSMRDSQVYNGKAEITKGNIHFSYKDSVPAAGKTAIYDQRTVSYIDGDYSERVEVKLTKLRDSVYDEISIYEIRKIFKMVIDLPELQQYFHIDKIPERGPIKIKEFGPINSITVKGIKKFNKPIKILKNKDLEETQINDFLEIVDWRVLEEKLRIKMNYPIEGIRINYLFERVGNNWKIIDSLILEN